MKFSIETQKKLCSCDFIRRGSAFFRVHGDGVLQVIKQEPVRPFLEGDICVGLFSMYGVLSPLWFTSRGCIPNYPVQNIIGKTEMLLRLNAGEIFTQEEVLCTDGIQWLTSIDTQEKMLNGILHLETSFGENIRWNDQLKIAPAMACGNYSFAKRVITAIILQHRDAYRSNRSLMPKDVFEKYIEPYIDEDLMLEQLLQIIEKNDYNRIQTWLSTNYAQNQLYATSITSQKS